MPESLYRRARRILRPIHPNRLLYYARFSADLLGYQRLRSAVRRARELLRGRARGPLERLGNSWRFARDTSAAIRRRRREPRLTVAVDIAPFWEPLTGIGWYLHRLLEHCAERDDVRLRLYGPHLIDTPDLPRPRVELPRGPAIEVVTYPVPERLSIGYVFLVKLLRKYAARLVAADRNEVLFAPNYFLPPGFHRCRGRLVATVHDLSFQQVPWTMREETRRDLLAHLETTVARAARVLTDTRTVLGELLESGLVSRGRAHAVWIGPGPMAAIKAGGALPPEAPRRYALHVGTLEPRKNLGTLIAAWRLLRERGTTPPPLVFCGRFGWKTEELREEMAVAEREGWLIHFGYLRNEDVAALYHRAHLVALPSIYEGFGMPAVEAMCAGAPLVMSDIPVLREVGGDAARYVSPEDPAAWADAIGEIFTDEALREDLAARSLGRRHLFDWYKTAEGTVEVWNAAREP